MESYTVHISFQYIKYIEPNGTIELDVEPLITNESIVYVPSEAKWDNKYGEWLNIDVQKL